jgi:hypothetical protein
MTDQHSGGTTLIMKHLSTILLPTAPLSSFAEDRPKGYQVGTYVKQSEVDDGTITSTIRGDGTTVAGGVYSNHVTIYRIRVADGPWRVETLRQAGDAMLRDMIDGRRVILCFHFQTGDAIGMSMAYKATDVVCKMIRDSVDPEEFWLHSNFTTIKKTKAEKFVNGYGKSAMEDVTIPRKLVERLNTTLNKWNDIFSGRC